MKDSIIYHPLIDPNDASLIKTAALYWDEMFTIVPETMPEPYWSNSSREASRENFLKPRRVNPKSTEVYKAGEEILRDIERQAIQQEVKHARNVSDLHSDKTPDWLHMGKLSEHVRCELFQTQRPDERGFYRVAEGFGSAYMSRLVAAIAKADQSVPITNKPTSHNVVIDRYGEPIEPSTKDRVRTELAFLSMETVALDESTPLTDILRFRDAHRKQLAHLKQFLRQITRTVSETASYDEATQIIKETFQDEIVDGISEVKNKLRENHIGFRETLLETEVAILAGWIISGEYIGAVTGGGIGLGFSIYRTLRDRNRIISGEPLGYLLKARQQLGAQD